MVPEGAEARVRRFEVQRATLRRLAGAAGVAALVFGVLAVDWVRLRRQAEDVTQLRAESAAQQEQLRGYGEQVQRFETQLAQLREFERKLRVIANLPSASPDGADGVRAPAEGVGGGADDPELATPPLGAPTGAHARSAAPALADDEDAGPAAESAGAAPSDSGSARGPVSAPPAAAGPAEEKAGSDAARAPAPPTPLAAMLEDLSRRAQRRLGSLQRLVAAVEAKAAQLAATPSTWPTRGWLTSRYGYRISPFTGLRDFHAGIDIAAEPGTEIVAPARGRVSFVGRKGAFGNTVILDHGYGLRTTYGHTQRALVRPGQSVERGQAIARVGSSGRSTGPHLHYALEVNGRFTNPADYILE